MRFPFGILGGQIYISAIMNKIIKQEKQVYAMERKQVLLKKEQKDLKVKLMEIRCNLRKPEVHYQQFQRCKDIENVLAVKNDLNKAEEKPKKVQKMQSDWDAKQNEKMYLVISATEHTEVSMEEQKKSIKERLEERRQEVKKQEKQQKVKKTRSMEL